jgi:hypothetical protein
LYKSTQNCWLLAISKNKNEQKKTKPYKKKKQKKSRLIRIVSICADKLAIGIPKPSYTHCKGSKNGFAPVLGG